METSLTQVESIAMKLKTNTMLLAIAALVFAGSAIFWEVTQRDHRRQQSELNQKADLFSFKEDDVTRLEVSPEKGTTLIFERTAESFPNTWKMMVPQKKVADEAAIAFLLDQLASSKTQNTVTIEKSQWPDFGIAPDNPQAKITLKNGTTHQLLLGGETFDKKHLYALVDIEPPLPDSVIVSIVPTTLLDAVQRPLEEWEYDPKALPFSPDVEPKVDQKTPQSSPDKSSSAPNNSEVLSPDLKTPSP